MSDVICLPDEVLREIMCSIPWTIRELVTVSRMVSKSWCNRNLLKTIDYNAPLVQNLADLYPAEDSSRIAPYRQLEELLCEMENLRNLNLAELLATTCKFSHSWTDWKFLRCLSRLEFISLSGFKGDTSALMKDALEYLPQLSTLDMTCIWKTVHISPNLKELKTLWLGDSSVDKNTMIGIAGLPSLTTLDLSLTNLSVRELEALGKSISLKSLSLICSKVSSSGLSHLTSLTELDLSSASFRGTSGILKLKNLKKLVLPATASSHHEIAILEQTISGISIQLPGKAS